MWAQPANDACAGATSVIDNGSCTNGTTVAANDNITGEAGCATPGPPGQHLDVWYTFTANYTQEDIVVTAPSWGTVEVLLASGTCSALTLVNSNCGSSPLTSTFTSLTVGTVYTVIVSAPNNATGALSICVTGSTPPVVAGQDCATAEPICSSGSFGGNSSGFGVQELPNNNTVDGCLTTEHQSSWYMFQVGTNGTLELTISPASTVDYDFAIWGPNVTCPMSVSPIRCSWAADVGDTGLSSSDSDTSEGVGGNGFLSPLSVVAGQTYYLLIDNFTANSISFSLNWGGSAVLNCAVLPVEMMWFDVVVGSANTKLQWATATENDNLGFYIERSEEGNSFQRLDFVRGAGYSQDLLQYSWLDNRVKLFEHYAYRIAQMDYNGVVKYYYPTLADGTSMLQVDRVEYRNCMGQLIGPSALGLIIKTTYFVNGEIQVEKICVSR